MSASCSGPHVDDVWPTYSNQQLADVLEGFETGRLALVYVADRSKISIEAANWLSDCNAAMMRAIRLELRRRLTRDPQRQSSHE